ncbi:MAG: aminoacyl-tRNA hydrolase [Kordiimonadaceae bacterium]|nr:aminoacyl-tRNA hydrolase [Kordiimonadaceae bacterium]MBO6568133.1 aminoacyl-tRNA hydrolase [Kordiimonadaceae bacterium]MBO6964137.1 aminoacyl-tRNA hydrolase [Kordiimonadaceae bacterium]
MLNISETISIDEQEVAFTFVRSPGPGGQNVNKVATAAQLRFDARNSRAISDAMFARVKKLAGSRMTADGVIVITAHTHRTQRANKEAALSRLTDLLRQAEKPPTKRVKTKPSRASKERRLTSKKQTSGKKQLRGKVRSDD